MTLPQESLLLQSRCQVLHDAVKDPSGIDRQVTHLALRSERQDSMIVKMFALESICCMRPSALLEALHEPLFTTHKRYTACAASCIENNIN